MDYEKLKEGILSESCPCACDESRVRARTLLTPAGKQILGYAKKLYRAYEKGKTLSEDEVWLCDNAFYVEETLQNELKRNRLYGTNTVKLLCAVQRRVKGVFDEEALKILFEAYCREKRSDAQVRGLTNTLAATLLLELADKCEREDLRGVSELIQSLRFLQGFDAGTLIWGFSPLECILRSDATNIYPQMEEASRAEYRRWIVRAAKKEGIPPEDYARRLLEKAREKKVHFGLLLPRPLTLGGLYGSFLGVLFLVLSILGITLLLRFDTGAFTIVACVLLPIGALTLSVQTADFVFSHLAHPKKLVRLSFERVPRRFRTLSVITAVVRSQKEIDELCERLREAYFASFVPSRGETELFFGLLLDFPPSPEQESREERVLLSYAVKKIERLSGELGDYFYLFTRKKRRNGQGEFCGWERKRGALLSLVRFLRAMPSEIQVYGASEQALREVKYVLTLDADTRISLGAVQELIGIIAHPMNAPVLGERRGVRVVTGGYGVLQPRVAPTLRAAQKTPFCLLQSGAGGTTAYAAAAFDRAQTLFSRGLFCGKGLFDVDLYLAVLSGAFPEGRVLSHDLLEGARLRCAAVTDVLFSDEVPQTPAAFDARAHRWCRGDTQALFFATRCVRNARGEREKNPIDCFYKACLWDNLRRALFPVSGVVLLFLTLFLSRESARVCIAAALFPILLPCILECITFLFSGRLQPFFRKFSSRVYPGIWNRIFGMLWELSGLFTDAVRNFSAISVSLFRMLISHKNTLLWQTARHTGTGGKLTGFFGREWISVCAGVVLLIFSVSSPVRFTGFAFLCHPVAAFFVARPFRPRSFAQLSEREKLREYAHDTAQFFLREVSSKTNDLPPDHLTVAPQRRLALRTSPTNIGLYFASLIASSDFGFLSEKETFERLEKGLSAVEKLPTFHGLLYNWYRLDTLEILGKGYVSSVDCGNFLVCLRAVRAALLEKRAFYPLYETLVPRIDALCEGANLRFLYRAKRGLFSVGYDTEEARYDNSDYDLYMSEARMCSYYAVAHALVPKRHWAKLSRPLICEGAYLGEASFSGTAFEYFMPLLFLPLSRGAADDEALRFAFLQQRMAGVKTTVGEVFGVSESAFYAFDADGDYPYRAAGIPALAIRRDLPPPSIISPYSSFLMLPMGTGTILRNLNRLKKLGVYGAYGFYEAVQIRAEKADVVYSYMAHHVGMSLVAAANAVFDNVFCRRFLSGGEEGAARSLLEERIPVDAVLHRRRGARRGYEVLPPKKTQDGPFSCDMRAGMILPGKDALLSVQSDGICNVLLRHAGRTLSCVRERVGDVNDSFVVRALLDGELFSSAIAENKPGTKCEMRLVTGGVCFSLHSARRRVEFTFTLGAERTFLCIHTQVYGECDVLRVGLSFAPLFSQLREYEAHPAFSILGLEASVEDETFFVRRRTRDTQGGMSLALREVFRGRTGLPKLLCAEALEEAHGAKDAFLAGVQEGMTAGAMPSARVLCTRAFSEDARSLQHQHTFVIGFGESAALAKSALEAGCLSRTGTHTQKLAAQKSADKLLGRTLLSSGAPAPDSPFARRLTERILNAGERVISEGQARFAPREALYALRLSGDLPIVGVRVDAFSPEQQTLVHQLIALKKYHAICSLSYDLVFLCPAREGYLRPIYHSLMGEIHRLDADYLYEVFGGIFIVDQTPETISLIEDASCVYLDGAVPPAREQPHRIPLSEEPKRTPAFFRRDSFLHLCEGKGGSFFDGGFLIEKNQYNPKSVFSHILASSTFGVLLTHRSLGTSFETSSKFRRLSAPCTDAFGTDGGERLLLEMFGKVADLAECASEVAYFKDRAEYYGSVFGVDYQMTVFAHPKLLLRGVRVRLGARKNPVALEYQCVPVLGEETGVLGKFYASFEEDTLLFSRAISALSRPFSGYLLCVGPEVSRVKNACALKACVPAGEENTELVYYLGAKESERQFARVRTVLRTTPFEVLQKAARRESPVLLPDKVLLSQGKDVAFCEAQFVNFWLPYQTLVSRLFARCGFYQPGGAYGFRDQLQDALLFLSYAPKRTERLLLRAAAHQFSEGDVQHWWHNLPDRSGAHAGVRTRCADDYLWLVYTACAYERATGNRELFFREIPFLECRQLASGERDLYCYSGFSRQKAPLWEHLRRAADLFVERGTGNAGLPLILDGDWNDGLNRLPAGTQSVFLAQFGAICLNRLAKLFKALGVLPERAAYYEAYALAQKKASFSAFDGTAFARAVFADGSALEAEEREGAFVDVLPQAFSAFCFLEFEKQSNEEDLSKVLCALETAYRVLFDERRGTIRLFKPPFPEEGAQVGYIRGYAEGVRENGGQYTHAAAWYALSCKRIAHKTKNPAFWRERAERVARALLPARAALEVQKRDRYQLEPYALCGDVWCAPGQEGRGGWSWYTGSAGWLWRFFEE